MQKKKGRYNQSESQELDIFVFNESCLENFIQDYICNFNLQARCSEVEIAQIKFIISKIVSAAIQPLTMMTHEIGDQILFYTKEEFLTQALDKIDIKLTIDMVIQSIKDIQNNTGEVIFPEEKFSFINVGIDWILRQVINELYDKYLLQITRKNELLTPIIQEVNLEEEKKLSSQEEFNLKKQEENKQRNAEKKIKRKNEKVSKKNEDVLQQEYLKLQQEYLALQQAQHESFTMENELWREHEKLWKELWKEYGNELYLSQKQIQGKKLTACNQVCDVLQKQQNNYQKFAFNQFKNNVRQQQIQEQLFYQETNQPSLPEIIEYNKNYPSLLENSTLCKHIGEQKQPSSQEYIGEQKQPSSQKSTLNINAPEFNPQQFQQYEVQQVRMPQFQQKSSSEPMSKGEWIKLIKQNFDNMGKENEKKGKGYQFF